MVAMLQKRDFDWDPLALLDDSVLQFGASKLVCVGSGFGGLASSICVLDDLHCWACCQRLLSSSTDRWWAVTAAAERLHAESSSPGNSSFALSRKPKGKRHGRRLPQDGYHVVLAGFVGIEADIE